MTKSSKPIGIFDSGIGGLTLVHAIDSILPNENIIYFGDTAHMPYGEKSQEEIQSYSLKITDFLIQQDCKLILIACNSASATAFESVKTHVSDRAHVLNVIDPVVEYVSDHFANQNIGLIGTRQTINSNIYEQKIERLKKNIHLKSLATPLLAPMIEEGYCHDKIAHDVINNYLSSSELVNLDAMILGCTHYPLIKKEIESFYEGKVEVIDASLIIAEALKSFLMAHKLLNNETRKKFKFYLSDYTDSFLCSAKRFFGGEIQFEHYPLWR